jgi:hypothetical protein
MDKSTELLELLMRATYGDPPLVLSVLKDNDELKVEYAPLPDFQMPQV